MDSRMHTAVKRETQLNRNAAARARRGAIPGKSATVTLLDAVSRTDGTPALFAVSASDPARGYLLTRDDAGEWSCNCFNARWMSLRGGCAHVAAIEAAEHEQHTA